jgi:uncharacterized FAD-dependent dehydrogenase
VKKVIIEFSVSPKVISESGESKALLAELRHINPEIGEYDIIRKSIDARKRSAVVIKYRCVVELPDQVADNLTAEKKATEYTGDIVSAPPHLLKKIKIIIVGAGPAGLFCALRLVESGAEVTILERGNPVPRRDDDLRALQENGLLDPESNVLFGEGGAGTYSDGKLTTRIHRGPIDYIFRTLVRFGAPSSILYDAKPHVGTDLLTGVVSALRAKIEEKGGQVFFGERVTGFISHGNRIMGVRASSGAEYRADAVVLATGHSARDIYKTLSQNGVTLEKKGFSAGFRIEHPAEFINKIQYGSFAKYLPAADYRLAYNDPENGRGVYSFCMCPGGEVINSSSEAGHLCVNGMSRSARSGAYSNAAIVVTLAPDDFPGGVLSGIDFQRQIEKKGFDAGGGGFSAPVQSAADFIRGARELKISGCSYQPGSEHADLSGVFPGWMKTALSRGLRRFNQIIPGFVDEGICVGVETRTSSPVRVVRDGSMQSISHKGLYPVGEGAGYAGGIVSSAVDGVNCADVIIANMGSEPLYCGK